MYKVLLRITSIVFSHQGRVVRSHIGVGHKQPYTRYDFKYCLHYNP